MDADIVTRLRYELIEDYQVITEAADEIERLRDAIDSVLACDGSDRTTHVTVEIPFDLYHQLEEARRG